MLLFRLADVPRTLRRLTPPIPVAPDTAGIDVGDALNGLSVDRMLRPGLLDTASARTRARIVRVIALYATAEGQPRSAVDALAPRIEEIFGDYRLARCVARTIEDMGYHFAPPPRALSEEPAALRARCYRRAQEIYGGYVPRARRDAFLEDVAAELRTTPERLEGALWADRTGAALLRAGPAGDDVSPRDDNPPQAAQTLDPAGVIARYNAAAVATILSASAWVTISLPATETVALKELYRHAKARHVGVEIALRASTFGEGAGDLLAVTLYGPGSRALVRGRRVQGAGNSAEPAVPAAVTAGHGQANGATIGGDSARGIEADEDPEDVPGGIALDGASVPAPGGPPVASVVSRLLLRHPRAVRDGWARLLGLDRRLLHVPLDADALAALRGVADDRSGEGEAEVVSYDSGVEETFARAFHAAEAGGPLGVARGWTMEREPRVVIVDGVVFLPDFSFRRGDVEVFCEVAGYYTEDYLARKRRKLAHLRGRIALLLVVDEERAPLFSAAGFPLVTYRAGRGVGVTDVVQALDAAFDPFARRRARAVRTLATLCAADGPRLGEEELCAALGCAGRTEVTDVWSELAVETPGTQGDGTDTWVRGAGAQGDDVRTRGHDEGTRGDGVDTQSGGADAQGDSAGAQSDSAGARDDGLITLKRRYVPGYGLVTSAAIDRARVALAQLLEEAGEAGGAVPLDDALACCERAGLPDADEALIDALGGVVVRSGLFGEAQVHRPGAEAEQALTAALSASPPGRRRRHRA